MYKVVCIVFGLLICTSVQAKDSILLSVESMKKTSYDYCEVMFVAKSQVKQFNITFLSYEIAALEKDGRIFERRNVLFNGVREGREAYGEWLIKMNEPCELIRGFRFIRTDTVKVDGVIEDLSKQSTRDFVDNYVTLSSKIRGVTFVKPK